MKNKEKKHLFKVKTLRACKMIYTQDSRNTKEGMRKSMSSSKGIKHVEFNMFYDFLDSQIGKTRWEVEKALTKKIKESRNSAQIDLKFIWYQYTRLVSNFDYCSPGVRGSFYYSDSDKLCYKR